MLTEISGEVFVRQSEFCLSNAVVIRGRDGIVLVDPGVDGHDLSELADDLEVLGTVVVAGFSTHPHWDHVLWHERFGVKVPRYGTAACAAAARDRLSALRAMTAGYAPGAPLDLVGGIVPLPAGSSQLPGGRPGLRVVEHQAHAPGHAAVVVDGAGVLIAGDMLSDVEIPLLDPGTSDPCGDYLTALDLLDSEISNQITAVIPGHGGVAAGPAIRSRLEADRAYLHALLRGANPADPRIGPDATYGRDWLPRAHQRNRRLARPR